MESTCNLQNSSLSSCAPQDWHPVWPQGSSFSWTSRWKAIAAAENHREGLRVFPPD
jgi:hypothetical protein